MKTTDSTERALTVNDHAPLHVLNDSIGGRIVNRHGLVVAHAAPSIAHVLAAAPDLLKALKDLLSVGGKTVASQKILNARTAIAKAEGRKEKE